MTTPPPKDPLPPLSEEEIQTTRITAQKIADEVGELKLEPRAGIWRITRALGIETALALLTETQTIEANGGMLIDDQSRRRTPGGVYFHLARQRLQGHPALSYVFPPWYTYKKKKTTPPTATIPAAPQKAPQPISPAPTFTWAERQPLITEALQQAGGSTTTPRPASFTNLGSDNDACSG